MDEAGGAFGRYRVAIAKERTLQDLLAQRDRSGFSDRLLASDGGEFTHPSLA